MRLSVSQAGPAAELSLLYPHKHRLVRLGEHLCVKAFLRSTGHLVRWEIMRTG